MKAKGVVKVPLFSEIFNFGAEYLGNETSYSNTLTGFFGPYDKENWLHRKIGKNFNLHKINITGSKQ